jgi:anti-sigma factor RsiW
MKHSSIWQWTDYVRSLGDELARSAMDAHLSSGCARCQRIVNVLRAVAAAAPSEAGFEPPEHAVRYAKAIYSLSRPEKTSLPRLIARLVHDSSRAPLPAGMRSQDRTSRHALYEAGSYSLDLQLEQQQASGLVMLIGQIADRQKPATSTADVPIWLMDRKKLVTSTLCNSFGEFQLEYAPVRDLRLHVPLRAAGKRLDVPLDRLTPGLPSKPRPAKITRRRTRRKPERL